MIRNTCLLLFAIVCSLWGTSCGQNKKAGDSCFGTYECTPGLFCASGVCIVPSGQKGCKVDSDCPQNYKCRFFVCENINTLRACTVSQASTQCAKDQVCNNGFCSTPGEGEPCQNQQCRLGLFCDNNSTPAVCRRGQVCNVPEDCSEGFVCELNRCVRERDVGECTDSSDCEEGEICNEEGVCETP